VTEAVSYRDMAPGDIAAGLRLCRAAGWNQREADWQMLLSLGTGRFRVAESEGRVVGTAGAACYGRDLAWVCMVLVDPEHRGWGTGTRLMEEVLARLDGFGAVGLDATPAGRPVYARLGFVDGAPLARLQVRAGTATPPDRARSLRAVDLGPVLTWDREAFGADRSSMLRWALAQAPEYAWIVAERGRVDGYCFGRHGHHSEHIGAVVARSPEIAKALVAAALSGAAGRSVIVDVPTSDAAWVSALGALGFVTQRPFTRMYRGARLPGSAREVFAAFGPEFG
jgi:GNAT superfamily N-acetyltransferase